ncbi:MAG: MaoC family dehydratase [Nocardioides sp.]|uniref:MaoC family dehydratase n=1 Tax=Nocardioides sp. TaxID=35761 RepID=UPI0039E710CD
MTTVRAEGPCFDELEVGQVFDAAPEHTLTEGRQAVHQSIVGDRLRLPLSDALAVRVAGAPLAHPALAWDVAIGQSTVATHHVKANLFYRDLVFHRLPRLGDTLRTTTTVVGLRENQRREGRTPTGLAALRMRTVDQEGRTVLDFHRCAMLPLRGADPTGRRDDLDRIGGSTTAWTRALEGLDLGALPRGRPLAAGETIEVVGGDVVTSGPELARLTLNVASVHHDAVAAGGGRLVYGGHTIGIALSQAVRALPDLVTVLGWHGCDHVGPVREGDTLRSTVRIERADPGPDGRQLVHLRSVVTSDEGGGPVLDWRFVALA